MNVNRMRDHVPGYREHLFTEVDRAIREWDGKLIVLPSTPTYEPRPRPRLVRKALNQLGRRWRETIEDGTYDGKILSHTCWAFRLRPEDVGIDQVQRRQDAPSGVPGDDEDVE